MSQYLFSTIEQIKAHFPVAHTNLGINDIKPFMLLAQNKYLKPILGDRLYDQLMDYVDASGDSGSGSGSGTGTLVTDAWLERLLQQVRPAVAHLMHYESMPFAEIKWSKTGIHQVVGDELQPIFSTQRQRLEAAMLKLGYNGLEDILVWLEAKQSHFEVWTASTAYTNYKGHFIESATMFTQYWGKLDNKRMTYVALMSIMQEVERSTVKNILGATLYATMKSELTEGGMSDENTTLLTEYIRPLVAYRTAHDAMPYLTMSIEAYGVFSQVIYQNERNVQAFDRPSETRFVEERERLDRQATKYAADLKKYLNDNVSTYTEFESSDAYDEDNTETRGSIDDQEDNGIVMF